MSNNHAGSQPDSAQDAGNAPQASTSRPAPLDLQQRQQEAVSDEAANVFDRLVALNMDSPSATSPVVVSHPSIFRKGTLIEIPEVSPRSPQRRRRRSQAGALRSRLVAVCIKNDAQAENIVEWVLQNELVPNRDQVVLINVRQAANSLIGDLTMANNAKEDAERLRSHELLRKHAIPIKQEGFPIKGVSIRGIDVRGELVRKLIELKCDLVISGCHQTKSIRERLTGCKVMYLVENSPCPVLVVGQGMQRYKQDSSESQQP
ncbi:hypothetical protein IWW55_000467 [Coemansia sp. RSA 2706]|nr:hypothetical protein IWW54_004856 [Coemansia sp. RSA 2705]KAJ2308376.1 hypothetical protein IWW55_000467 [Coemansia sp. RSA 2706]KAJ2392825.1 hypothetical protein H4S02_000576 [Coemansia sp. RSA 2611]